MTHPPFRLLVAEDDSEMRALLRKVLEREGFDVAVAGDGEAALAALRGAQRPFDLLVSDVCMPGKDGVALLREARALRPGLPVVLITAHSHVDQYLEVMREGAFEYLAKPFKIPDLLQILERALQAGDDAAG